VNPLSVENTPNAGPHSGLSPRQSRGSSATEGISVVINTLNEEANIRACIQSVDGLADDIVVCDMHSDDRTAAIASELGARVIEHDRTGFVEPARRWAIQHATREWVLVLDADERMTPRLAARLREVVEDDNCDVVSFWSLYWYFCGWARHGGFFHGSWKRFFRRSTYLDTYRESERVHRNFESLSNARRILRLPSDYYILHFAYPTVEKYLSKTLGTYARIEGEQYVAAGRRFSLFRMVAEPVKEFVVRFILRRGFMDGMQGFVLVCLYAGYRFSVWANVWAAEARARPGSGEPRDR
jgi:(heptosyl)LPS beta-1,4-glucosyltransferase